MVESFGNKVGKGREFHIGHVVNTLSASALGSTKKIVFQKNNRTAGGDQTDGKGLGSQVCSSFKGKCH